MLNSQPIYKSVSGVIGPGTALNKTRFKGLVVTAPVTDGAIVIYDAEAAGPAAAIRLKVSVLKGTSEVVAVPFQLQSRGYVVVSGGAEVTFFVE